MDRRAYQLRVLAMIREQLPLSSAVAAASIASPWEEHDELAWELARITAPVTVVGPARAMLVLVRGSARNVADALSEALRGPRSHTRAALSPALLWPEWTRTTAAVASRLREMAAAAEAFTDTYVSAVLLQSYSFDRDHDRSFPTSSGSRLAETEKRLASAAAECWGGGAASGPMGLSLDSGTYRPPSGAVSVGVTRPERRPFFTPKTLAAYLALSERTVREMLRRGALPSYRVGGARRIDPSDVDSYLAGRREGDGA